MRFWVILLLLCAISFATAYNNRKTKKGDDELPPLADGDSEETPADDEEHAKKTVSKKKVPTKKKVSEEEEEETEEVSEDEPKHTDKKTNKSSKVKSAEKKKSDKAKEDDSELGCSDSKDDNTVCICEDHELNCNKLIFEDGEELTTTNVEVKKKNFNVTKATFDNNAITSLRKGIIVPGREKEIHVLSINNNRVMRIETGAFEEFTNLKKLYLENNKISKLTKGMFKGLGDLHHLHLDSNKLTEIEAGVFSELKSLKRLDLDYNKLTFKKEMFTGLESLEELSLDSTGIGKDSIPIEIFDLIPNLKKLSLRNNKYVDVPRAVNALSKLEDLDLSGSDIAEIHGQSFKDDHGVKYIRLTEMPYLYSIQDCAFCGLDQLQEIDLSNSTHLDHIHENAFGYAKTNRRQSVNLKKINLENCNLTTISEELLYYDSLEHLGIGGNPINCTCETAFLMNSMIYDFEFTNNLPKCKYPKELAGQPLAKLDAALACPGIRRGNTVWRGVKILSIIFLLTLVTSAVFMLYSRGLLQSCYKSARHGAPAFPSMSYANLNNTDDGQSLEQDFQPRPEQV